MGWDQLLSIQRDNAAQLEEDAQRPPEECPYDGAKLVVGKNGVRSCPFGNYRWEG